MAKALLNVREIQAKTGLNLVGSFLTLLVVNYMVLLLAHALFPTAIVLGTVSLGPYWALLMAAEKLALIGTFVMPLVTYKEWKSGKDYTPKDWIITYFVVDVIAVWLLARFALYLGFGISSWFVAVLLGTALDWAQGMAMMLYGKLTGQQS